MNPGPVFRWICCHENENSSSRTQCGFARRDPSRLSQQPVESRSKGCRLWNYESAILNFHRMIQNNSIIWIQIIQNAWLYLHNLWIIRVNYGPTVRSSMALRWDWPGKDCVNSMIVDNFDIGLSTKHIWSYYHWIGKHSQSSNLISAVKNSCFESFVCLHKTSVLTGKLYGSLALKRFKIWFRIWISDIIL